MSSPDIEYEVGWDGVPLGGSEASPLGLDTETEYQTDPSRIPRLALLSAHDGRRTVLVHPEQVGDFVLTHADVPGVWHNFAFDFWAVLDHLRRDQQPAAVSVWWQRADRGLDHDTMLLDALVRLADGAGETGSADFYTRGLGVVAREHCKIDVDKKDPYRSRYGELLGKRWHLPGGDRGIEEGFWRYAAFDAYAVHRVYPEVRKKALAHSRRVRCLFPPGYDPADRWGLLTERIQVKGAIALAQVSRNGMRYDPVRADAQGRELRAKFDEAVAELRRLEPGLFEEKWGCLVVPKTSTTRSPRMDKRRLTARLEAEVQAIREKYPDFETPISDGKLRGTSLSADDWEPYADASPFVSAWTAYASMLKQLAFYSSFEPPADTLFAALGETEPVLHPKYRPLMRTGRISCTSPNITQMPRDGKFRSLFVPGPGRKMFTADYSFIELRTLAATCLWMFGHSRMAEVIRDGTDPHEVTAAGLLEIPLENFQALKHSDPKRYKGERQSSKSVNFGIPGGLGGPKLSLYAKATYGVDMDVETAYNFRQKLISDIYPELSDEDGYLADGSLRALAMNTGLTVKEVENVLDVTDDTRWLGRALYRVLMGATTKSNGDPYSPRFFKSVWSSLKSLAAMLPPDTPLSAEGRGKLERGSGDPALARELLSENAVTLTGRIRGRTRYTQAKNTPFQGLAADGAKLAMYELVKKGPRVVAFVHDELVLELPEATAERDAAEVIRVMEESMEEVMRGPWGSVPAKAEGELGDHWAKP